MRASWEKSFRALWIAEFVAITGFGTTNPILPLYLHELGVSDPTALNWWTGLINSSTSIALAVFAPIWGSLADSYGRKIMLLRAMVGGAILVGLMGLTTAPWQLLALKTLQGCVTGTVAAATVLAATIVPPAEAGYRLGLLQTAVFLGNSAGPIAGGIITDLAGSRINFLATALLLAAAAFIVLREVQEDFVPKPKTGSVLQNARPDFSVLLAAPALISLFIVIFTVQLANAVVGPIVPLVVLDMKGTTAGAGSLSGLIVGASSVAGALAAAAIGKISGRIGYGRTLLGCIAGAFLFYVPQGFARSPFALLALRVGSGAFMGGTMPSVNALIASLCPRERQGATYGLSASISSAGMAAGPVLGALIASGIGYPAVFFTTSAILALTGGAVALGLRRKSGREELASGESPGTAEEPTP